MSEFSWKWIGRLSALIGIPAGLIAILMLFYQPDNGDCERIALQRAQANGELDRAQSQLGGVRSQVAKQEELVAYLASYLDRVTISGDALEVRRVELDRELRQLSVFRDRAATVEIAPPTGSRTWIVWMQNFVLQVAMRSSSYTQFG